MSGGLCPTQNRGNLSGGILSGGICPFPLSDMYLGYKKVAWTKQVNTWKLPFVLVVN